MELNDSKIPNDKYGSLRIGGKDFIPYFNVDGTIYTIKNGEVLRYTDNGCYVPVFNDEQNHVVIKIHEQMSIEDKNIKEFIKDDYMDEYDLGEDEEIKYHRKNTINRRRNKKKNNQRFISFLIAILLLGSAALVAYNTVSGIKPRVSAEFTQALTIRSEELIKIASDNLIATGIMDDLINNKNDDIDFSRLNLTDYDPVEIWAYSKAINIACKGVRTDFKELRNSLVNSITDENGQFLYYDFDHYCYSHNFVSDEPGVTCAKMLDQYVKDQLLYDEEYGLDSTLRINKINLGNNKSKTKSL